MIMSVPIFPFPCPCWLRFCWWQLSRWSIDLYWWLVTSSGPAPGGRWGAWHLSLASAESHGAQRWFINSLWHETQVSIFVTLEAKETVSPPHTLSRPPWVNFVTLAFSHVSKWVERIICKHFGQRIKIASGKFASNSYDELMNIE